MMWRLILMVKVVSHATKKFGVQIMQDASSDVFIIENLENLQIKIVCSTFSYPHHKKMSIRNSLGKFSQSVQAKDICILLVNDDYICQKIVAGMLDDCRYEAFSYAREMDALNMIREKKDETELVFTNVHRTYAKRHGIIEHIEKKFKLKIILMSPDADDINVSTVSGSSVTVYFMKSLSVNEMNSLWETALAREKNKNESSGKLSLKEKVGSKRTADDDDYDDEQHGITEKKPRVVWSKEMHQKFLEAVAQLGDDKAFPKKIVELMNVPGLTRANVASHLQKYRSCKKRAQEAFTGLSYDFTDSFGFKRLQESFQQSHWNPFQMGSRHTTTTPFNFNYYKSRSIMPQRLSLLKTIRLKPDHNYSIYGDETKNILLRSIEDRRVHQNTSFAGLRFARDGKSVVFGHNNHLSSSSVQQQPSFTETGYDNYTHFAPVLTSFTPQQSSVPPLGTADESVSINSQLSSLAALLDFDDPMPATMTQLQPSEAPPGFDWSNVATQPPSSAASTWSDWDEQLMFTCQQQQQQQQQLTVITPPQSAGLQWTDWAEPPIFSPQQPPSGNTANVSSDIFSDFTSPSLPPEFCELGAVGDDDILDATAVSVFDDLLFDNEELT
ncbi:hypothetical protein QVD17_21544 [Tagetes erecta]|uniref:HTH myb-type domain-containing protein n=1 Tax=Tagetes erecta TaxID=13708 RepID=A0AAD8KC37_TARER|nr:hypothetical protein QVD17_21544 [Tagetes erecta]